MSIFVLRRDGFPRVVWLGWNLDAPSEASESIPDLAQSPPSITDNNGTQPRTVRLLELESGLDVLGQTMTFETPKSC